MEHLPTLVRGLSKEQVRFYKLFAQRTQQGKDRKDLQLFDAMRKVKDAEAEEKVLSRLYPGTDKNAIYRLRNRLLSDLNKSLTIMNYEEDDFIYTCHLLGLYRYFSKKNLLQEARFYLRKAEQHAAAIEHFELLDIIYGEYVRLSHEAMQINPEVYIELRKKNKFQLEGLRAIDDLLAVVTYRLKTTQNFSPDKNPLIDLLKKTTDDFIKDRDLKNSPVLRFRIYQAVSQVLLQKHEYKSLELYLLRTFKEFERDKLFNRNNHDTKLQMLTYIVNTLFKNNKLRLSLQWAEALKSGMEEYHHILYDKYIFFYFNALVINYSILDREKAILILEDLKDNTNLNSNSYYQLFVYLNLAVLRFDQKSYKEAIRHFTKIYLLDGYKTADRSLRLKIALCEIITRYELQNYDVLEYKIAQVKKDYRDLLQTESNYAEKELLAIIKVMVEEPLSRKNKKLLDRCLLFLDWIRKNKEPDSVIIDYHNWLNDKVSAIANADEKRKNK